MRAPVYKTIARWSVMVMLPLFGTLAHSQIVVVIGNTNVKKVDAAAVLRLYTGRSSEIDGIPVSAVNAPVGSSIRKRFLASCLKQDEDRYTAHWTVRKYVGKGTSPQELPRSAEVLNYVASTPGAIGYLEESEIVPGVNILMRCAPSTAQSPLGYFVDFVASQWGRLTKLH
jgi:hypothetical protein